MSAAPTDCRVPDPSDKLDAKADGQFQAVNRRAGYGDDRLDRITATARKGWTLAAGEGLVLVQEIDRMQGAVDATLDHLSFMQDENAKLKAILVALRKPSDFVIEAIDATAWDQGCARLGLPACALVARAAVAAAEQEVAGE